ncbi:hypothetical protein [Breoghania sp.]|uniref:hypothetical protein n=1 Tax=Breoghania sp. TaxID=2065378 RepID=UPI0029CA8DA7|nr:hypothetical protein [Breoghania sp.]
MTGSGSRKTGEIEIRGAVDGAQVAKIDVAAIIALIGWDTVKPTILFYIKYGRINKMRVVRGEVIVKTREVRSGKQVATEEE